MNKLQPRLAWGCLRVVLALAAPLWAAPSQAAPTSASKPAGDKIALKLTLTTGQTWAFDQTYDASADTKATIKGQPQTISSKIHRHRSGKVELVSVTSDKPMAMRITFTGDCESSFESSGQPPQKVPFPYAGKTVTLTRQADGAITDDFPGQVDPAAQAELHAEIDPDTSIYPAEPKAVGDEWPGDAAAVAKMFPAADPHDQAGMSVKFVKLDTIAGRPTADLLVTISAFKEQQGVSTKLDNKSNIELDVQTGHPIREELKGTRSDSGDQTLVGPDGQPITYHESNGTVAMLLLSNLNGALPLATPGNPLLVPPASNPSFAGQYSDGKLTLDLVEAAGKYAGSITYGKKFPAGAAVRAGTLEGTFESEGFTYPFTATINGDTITLNSGGATYVLKKVN